MLYPVCKPAIPNEMIFTVCNDSVCYFTVSTLKLAIFFKAYKLIFNKWSVLFLIP